MKKCCFLLVAICLFLSADDESMSTISDNSIKVPIAYGKLGNELRSLQNSCKKLIDSSVISIETENKCNDYSKKVTEAFIVGNKADLNSAKNNDEAKNYLLALRAIDKNYKIVTQAIYWESVEARNKKNILLYTKLIEDEQIELKQDDYKFMDEHKEQFSQHPRYIAYIKSKDVEVMYSKKTPTYSNTKGTQKTSSTVNKTPDNYSNSKLQKIDLIRMNAHYTDNDKTLSISLFYMNKETDAFISWKNENIIVNCNAYESKGIIGNVNKGALLGKIENKTLTGSFQSIYINIPSTRSEYGVAECRTIINGKQFNNQATFIISN
jgi:hypothetical protein